MDFGKMVDVAIGLSMMFLMLSLFCTIINEYIASWLKIRSKTLKDGLTKLAGNSTEFFAVLSHPAISGPVLDPTKLGDHPALANKASQDAQQALTTAQNALNAAQGNGVTDPALANAVSAATFRAQQAAAMAAQLKAATTLVEPSHDSSYVSGRSFATALLDTINPSVQLTDTDTYNAIAQSIDALPDGHLKLILRGAVNNTSNKIEAVRDAAAHWFDGEMERLQGQYKRWAQRISLLVGLALAVSLNVDTLNVASVLWQDHALATKIADSAAQMMVNDKAQGQTISSLAEAEKSVSKAAADFAAAKAESPMDAAKVKGLESTMNNAIDTRDKLIPAVSGNVLAYKNALAPLPIGWSPDVALRWKSFDLPSLGLQALGWILTALALAMGAPFWFDTLNKFINIRSAGARPATTAQLQQAEQGR